jgi:hypothetical protein
MTRRSGARALWALAGAMGLVALAGCYRRREAERSGPYLSISSRESTIPAHGAVSARSVALALGGLPPEELTRLRDWLAHSTDAAARRGAPALFDLGLDEGEAPAIALPDVPAWTAATNVLGAPWLAPGLSVELGKTCADGASRCLPLFASDVDPDDALARRGRALAWSLGNAALLRTPAASREARLQSLRRAQLRPSSTIALVFGAPRGALDDAELTLLRGRARSMLADLAADAPLRPWLEALGTTPPSWELPISFDADQVLVIPRLSVLARLQDFRSEVALATTLQSTR